ncbi:MAG: hypothetical protein IJU98_08800 [Synergistaceae bacterium]|nr:hypothetical protein [Synergistaceae bacterium]
MTYSLDFRKCVIDYRNEGHTQQEAQEVFKVCAATTACPAIFSAKKFAPA